MLLRLVSYSNKTCYSLGTIVFKTPNLHVTTFMTVCVFDAKKSNDNDLWLILYLKHNYM